MFAMLSQLFRTITLLFTAGEKVAHALNNLAGVGQEMSQSYSDIARIERKADFAKRLAELGIEDETAPVVVVAEVPAVK